MRKLVLMVAGAAAGALLAMPAAQGIGIAAKMKAKKVQGDLVPAFYPTDSGEGTGDDENEVGTAAFQDAMAKRSPCTFLKAKFKIKVGKDARIKAKGVECPSGTEYTGQLCAHVKSLATIMDEDIAKDGSSQPAACIHPVAGHIEGTGNFVTSAIGLISCTEGKCDGFLPTIVADPCPEVDKVNEIRRIELFDGPDKAQIDILGNTLAACCGPGQAVIGSITAGGTPPCDTSTQRVLGEAGNITQGEAP